MDENKWIERLLVLASDKKELERIFRGSELINFVYRIYDEMFDFETNNGLIQVLKEASTFEMIIMNKRIVFVNDDRYHDLNVYVNDDLGSGDDSKLLGRVSISNKIYRSIQDETNGIKFDRNLLEKIATDLFKPLTENELLTTYSF